MAFALHVFSLFHFMFFSMITEIILTVYVIRMVGFQAFPAIVFVTIHLAPSFVTMRQVSKDFNDGFSSLQTVKVVSFPVFNALCGFNKLGT